ncbi:hypothetical protein IJ103_00955 [Candidatus Saccharibacteria bacterium]|nr:hypothetical protein [Candidatus Saccharibacteria bacterium]MBQ9016801.1 hypothetical protein [Candidatus Saccharibacteria bacterium]
MRRMVAKTKSNLKPSDAKLPFEISGTTDDEVYDSVVDAMRILHDRYVKDNLRRFARDDQRHKHFKLLPFWLIGWGDAHRYLEPIRTYAEERVDKLLAKEFEDMKVKASYIRSVKKYIAKLYTDFGDGPIKLREVSRKSLSEVIRKATDEGKFYDVYDVNINEFLAWDDQTRIRIAEQSRNRLAKLL